MRTHTVKPVSSNNIVMSAVPGALDMPDEYVRVPSRESRRVEATLCTSRRGRAWQTASLFNGHFLQYSARGQEAQVINLAYLSPDPVVGHESAWRWLWATVVIIGGAAVTAAFGQWQECALLSLAAMAALFGYLTGVQHRFVFRTRTGGIAVFELSTGLFQRAETDKFVATMRERITSAATILPSGNHQRFAAEIAEHRRMLMEGWLSKGRYDLAKKRIFARYQKMFKM